MPLLATVDDGLRRPGIPHPRRGTCPECRADMIAKTGSEVIWHWAHAADPGDCPYRGESEWHLAWKARGLDGTQEVWRHDFSRRADVFTPARFAVEFQRSQMDYGEVVRRERDWEHRLVWIFDGIRGVATGRLERTEDALVCWHTPKMLLAAIRPLQWAGWGCRAFIDLGDDRLWYASHREPLYDQLDRDQLIHGFEVSADVVVRNVLHADSATALAAMGLRMDLWQPVSPAVELVTSRRGGRPTPHGRSQLRLSGSCSAARKGASTATTCSAGT